MLALGSEVSGEPSHGGRNTEELITRMIATSAEVSKRPGHWRSDQRDDDDGVRGHLRGSSRDSLERVIGGARHVAADVAQAGRHVGGEPDLGALGCRPHRVGRTLHQADGPIDAMVGAMTGCAVW